MKNTDSLSEQRTHAAGDSPPVFSGYARADDGVSLFWRAVGSGPIIACANGVGVSTFFWKYLTEGFATHFTVVVWDYRGHGRSERSLDPFQADLSVVRHARDMATVIEAASAHIQQPAVSTLAVGHSMGCQVILELARQRPEMVDGFVLLLGTAGRALHTFFDNPRSPLVFRAMHRVLFRLGPRSQSLLRPLLASPAAWAMTTRLNLVDPYYCKREDMEPYLTHLGSLDPRIFIESVVQTDLHDAWDYLPEIDRPLLVIAAENDKFTPMWCSEKIVQETPGAELLVLADASHAALIEQPQTINHRIARFIRQRLPGIDAPPPP